MADDKIDNGMILDQIFHVYYTGRRTQAHSKIVKQLPN